MIKMENSVMCISPRRTSKMSIGKRNVIGGGKSELGTARNKEEKAREEASGGQEHGARRCEGKRVETMRRDQGTPTTASPRALGRWRAKFLGALPFKYWKLGGCDEARIMQDPLGSVFTLFQWPRRWGVAADVCEGTLQKLS